MTVPQSDDAYHQERSAEPLLSALEDPFTTFPLESVARELTRLLEETESRRAERSRPWGEAPPFHSVDDEHDNEVGTLLIGSAFVLAQGTIEATISIINRLGQLHTDLRWFPRSKREVLAFEAPMHALTGVSQIALVNVVANYTKHHYEWPADWHNASGNQRGTVQTVLTLGLVPNGGANNFAIALRELGATPYNLSPLAKLVIDWRVRMGTRIRREFNTRTSHW
jgi:hypothetical protein